MPDTLPQLTQELDDQFTETWYTIKPQAVDNILDSLVLWVALRDRGCMEPKVGGDFITETIKYGKGTATAVRKGDTLPAGTPELETMGIWQWAYVAAHVQRDLFTDQQNAGPDKVKDYVNKRLTAARDALEENFNDILDRDYTSSESDSTKQPMGLNHVLPPYANRASDTHGSIARSNSWWQCKYKALTLPTEIHFLADLRTHYNTVGDNLQYPDLVYTTQTLYETYEDFGLDKSQIVRNGAGRLLDLGFQTVKFKGADMIWSSNATAGTAKLLNTNWIKITYDPTFWFDMTEFKPTALEADRIAHILCALQVRGIQPRRQGLLYTA